MMTRTRGMIGMLLGALVAGLVVAAPVTAAAPGRGAQTWVRAEIVDSQGHSSGQFVDSREDGRILVVDPNSGFHYLRHVGVDAPGTVLSFTFIDSATGLRWYQESLTTRNSGAFSGEPMDLSSLLIPGVPLTVVVHDAGGQLRMLPTAIEYAVML